MAAAPPDNFADLEAEVKPTAALGDWVYIKKRGGGEKMRVGKKGR